MNERTYPLSVQPGIPRLSNLKPGWARLPIGELFEVVTRPANMQDDQRYRLVTVRRSRGGLDLRSEMYGREISVKSQFFVQSGDFLISKRQIVHGACGIVPGELDGAIVSNEYSVLRCRDVLDPEYLVQLIHSTYIQQTFFHSSIGVHIEKMIFKLADWFKWQVNLPPLPEQRKIAAFLGATDERIVQVTRKKALLEDYKKGCMQQLFSQSIRFKDDQGNDFPDWEEKRLGEKVQVLAGLTYSPDDIRENGTLVLRSSNVQSGEIALEDNVYVDLKTSKANMSKKYDILLCVRNGSQRLIGKSAIIKKHMENTTHGAFMTVLRGEDNLFIFQLLQTQLFFKEVHKNLGATINSINGSDLKKMRFFIPSSKDERRKIADFLSAIDTKIDLVAQELEQAKTFKKGLLQQMFV